MRLITLFFTVFMIWSCGSPEPQKAVKAPVQVPACLSKYIQKGDSVLYATVKTNIGNVKSYFIVRWYPNGAKKSVTQYDDCKKSGRDTLFYDNGQIKYVRYVIGSAIMFTYEYYSKSGDSLNPGNVKWGHGTIYNYYENGKLERAGPVKNGYPVGEWKSYHPNGEISSTTCYHNENTEAGLEFGIHGIMRKYRESGVIEKEYTVDKNVVRYVKEFDEKGVLVKEYADEINFNFKED